MINRTVFNITLIATLIGSIFFVLFPEYDLAVSDYFYTRNGGFLGKDNRTISLIFYLVPFMTKLFAALCAIIILINILRTRSLKKIYSSIAFYLLLAAAIGPGLIVNYGFKENFGRARPSQIVSFDGNKQFSPAFAISNQCDTNCSFSSGHAAMAFYFTAVAYVAAGGYFSAIFILGLIFGSIVGYVRIIMGGHFTSDVFVSAFVVILVNHVVYVLWKKLKDTHSQKSNQVN